jgi:ribosomal protein S18 acetylase RimI-like enzyme
MNPTLRAATASDVPGLLALWKASDAEPSHTDDDASLKSLITFDPAAVIVAEVDGVLVGSIIAAWDGWRGSIYRLVVAPTERRRGVARSLLAAAEARLAAVGAVRSQAIVVASSEHAIGFWRAGGWEQQSDRARFVRG